MSENNGERLDRAVNSKLALLFARILGPALLTALTALMTYQVTALNRLELAVVRLEVQQTGIDRRLTMIENRR